MTRSDAVVGLDIGTTKVCTVVGHGDADGRISIAGVGLAASRGLKKGVVIDVDDTITAIKESVERARHMAGVEIKSVVAGVTGDHIQSSNRRGTITIASPSGVVTEDDVQRVMHAAMMDVSREREILHVLPRDFSVDGQKGVRRPVGMVGQRLEVEAHIVTGQAGFLQNLVQCVERAGLQVDSLVLESIATAEAVATLDERELGVTLIDIGGGTSDIAVFVNGSIVFSAAIPVGGNHVTRDISIGLRTPFEIAERLKIERGVALPDLIPHGEALEVVAAGSGERLRLPRAVLGEIIEARMSELFQMARDTIENSGVPHKMAGGVILSGGGALLPGSLELAQQTFNLPARIGHSLDLSGWSEKVDTPQFATGVGLLRFALRQPGSLGNPLASFSEGHRAQDPGDAERRIWSIPAATAPPAQSTADSAIQSQGSDHPAQSQLPSPNAAGQQGGVGSTGQTHAEVAALSHAASPTVQPADGETPFDRTGGSATPSAESMPITAFLQRLLQKLRDLLGFETV